MLSMRENIRLIQRYEVLERALMRLDAGWAMHADLWDAKVALAQHMWENAQRVDRLRDRLKELMAGALDPDNETGLDRLADFAARAHNLSEYISGTYDVLKRQLLEAYRNHGKQTDFTIDDRTREILEEIHDKTGKEYVLYDIADKMRHVRNGR